MRTQPWSIGQSQKWYREQPWLVGCNYIPSTAINQLEMWQSESFDPQTIERELSCAASLGFNTVRVYLHDLLWEADRHGFLERVDRYLDIASSVGIRTLFVFFDACWVNQAHLGPQPRPIPGVHNSGWLQSPVAGVLTDRNRWDGLERYVKGLLRAFGDDSRVLMWDLYNEPGNGSYLNNSLPLLEAAFAWARAIDPAQPLTAGVWNLGEAFADLNRFQLEQSDLISFHNYREAEALESQIRDLQRHGRPIICTEYMARSQDSRFETHLPIFEREQVGCYSWGLVSGKTQTIYPWGSRQGAPEPEVWFHDILRGDGTPFDAAEVAFVRELLSERRPRLQPVRTRT
jgi:hypothetical protein